MSTVKLHTLARIPQDYDRRAKLADKRVQAFVWMRRNQVQAHGDIYTDAAYKHAVMASVDEALAYKDMAEGA